MAKPQTPEKSSTPTATIDTPRSVDTTEREDGDPSKAPKLPHERDESVDMTHGAPSEKMRQAHADIASGQQDTDARNTEARRLDPKNNPRAS
ncbi:hypothetical protein [Pantoea sp. 18069]|uniref:hypothetical protein n=1 Tax=Pantoea sp. 18069 TaxID=2681415 RepID=UPI00135CD37B|nr:hypothetical protein [Pantoea sp. 18069]